jgi:hypothetical protein
MADLFDLEGLDARDEAELAIRHPTTGESTTWVWTFYGPAHPVTVELANRVSRDALRELAAQKQARVNGKKWKEDVQSADDLQSETIGNIVARTKSFTPIKLGAETIEFSQDAAKRLLMDRKKGWLLAQIVEFLRDDESFMQPSANS